MILGCEGVADYHCGLQGLEVPVSSGTRPIHHLAGLFTPLSDFKRGSARLDARFDTRDRCGLQPSPSKVTGAFCVDLSASKSSVEGNCSDVNHLCLDSNGINLYIDLPCSPCKQSAEQLASRNTRKKVVNRGRGFTFDGHISTHTSPSIGRCDDCPQRNGTGWTPVSSTLDRLDISVHEVPDANSETVSHGQDMLERVPSLEMLKPTAAQDELEEHSPSRAEKEALSGPDLPRNLHEHPRAPSQGQFTSTGNEKSDMKVATNSRGLYRALGEPLEGLPYSKRRRLTTGSLPELQAQEKLDVMQRFEMPPVTGKVASGDRARDNQEVLAGPDLSAMHCQAARYGLAESDLESQHIEGFPNFKNPDSDGVDIIQILTSSLKEQLVQPALQVRSNRDEGLAELDTRIDSDAELGIPSLAIVRCITLDSPRLTRSSSNDSVAAQELGRDGEGKERKGWPHRPTHLEEQLGGLNMPIVLEESRVDLTCHSVESVKRSEIEIHVKGTHALRALAEDDDFHSVKNRKMTTSVDAFAMRDSEGMIGEASAKLQAGQTNESSDTEKTKYNDELLASADADAGSMICRTSTQVDTDPYIPAKESTGSLHHNEEKSCGCGIPTNSDLHGESSVRTFDGNTPLPSWQPEGSRDIAFVPKKKEWLVHYHSTTADTVIRHNAEFSCNVGHSYRSAIDDRPAAISPGIVGDGGAVQLCRLCGDREDATSSLICDSCDELFHMTCVNSRMKIVPKMDEWLCRQCKRKRKMTKDGENHVESDPGGDLKHWWRDDSGIGKIEKELLRMSNGKRTKVRVGPKYQAVVPETTGVIDMDDPVDTLADPVSRFGHEVPLTSEEKQQEQDEAEFNLANDIWPRGWLPAKQIPVMVNEKWLQCMLVLISKGDICDDGWKADKDIVCGKWRRAPEFVMTNDHWECSCALVWDPYHADCNVPQEMSGEEIIERLNKRTLLQQEFQEDALQESQQETAV